MTDDKLLEIICILMLLYICILMLLYICTLMLLYVCMCYFDPEIITC